MRDLSLPSQFKLVLPSSGLLPGVSWFQTDVSGLGIGPETSILNNLTPLNNPDDGRI